MQELIIPEMVEHFKYRTGYHLWCVRKWSDRIATLNDRRISRELLDIERDEHDCMKWLEPEYTPYLLISWRYKCQRESLDFKLPDDIRQKLTEATFHHIKNHRHHPEYWDEGCTIEALNPENRDKPGKRVVDGTNMPLTYVAAMCADWFAMSEELGNSPEQWAAANINTRWTFTNEQIGLINDLIAQVWAVTRS